jgi:hypothetical protein
VAPASASAPLTAPPFDPKEAERRENERQWKLLQEFKKEQEKTAKKVSIHRLPSECTVYLSPCLSTIK